MTVEMLDAFLRAYVQVHSKKGAQHSKPLEIPRPWKQPAKPGRSGTTLSELLSAGRVPVRHSAEGGDSWQR